MPLLSFWSSWRRLDSGLNGSEGGRFKSPVHTIHCIVFRSALITRSADKRENTIYMTRKETEKPQLPDSWPGRQIGSQFCYFLPGSASHFCISSQMEEIANFQLMISFLSHGKICFLIHIPGCTSSLSGKQIPSTCCRLHRNLVHKSQSDSIDVSSRSFLRSAFDRRDCPVDRDVSKA